MTTKSTDSWISLDLLLYPFHDDDSTKKAIIATLFGMLATVTLGLGLIPLWGYSLRILRGTINTGEPPLPDWSDGGDLLREGLRILAVRAFYFIPVILLYVALMFSWVMMVPGMALAANLPTSVGGAAGFGMMIIFFMVWMLGTALTLPLTLVCMFFAHMGAVRYAVTGSLKSAFDVRGVWALARFGFRYFGIAMLMWGGLYLLIQFAAGFVGATIILFPLIPIITGAIAAYINVMSAALFGKAYNQVKPALALSGSLTPEGTLTA